MNNAITNSLKFILLTLLIIGFNKASAQAPNITSFTPTKGNVGSTVVITGTNFNDTASNNIVYFGATKATIVSASATSLIVKVPSGATYSPISVLNLNGQLITYSSNSFNPTYSPHKSAITIGDYARLGYISTSEPSNVLLGGYR